MLVVLGTTFPNVRPEYCPGVPGDRHAAGELLCPVPDRGTLSSAAPPIELVKLSDAVRVPLALGWKVTVTSHVAFGERLSAQPLALKSPTLVPLML